jgi:hypothetical protein
MSEIELRPGSEACTIAIAAMTPAIHQIRSASTLGCLSRADLPKLLLRDLHQAGAFLRKRGLPKGRMRGSAVNFFKISTLQSRLTWHAKQNGATETHHCGLSLARSSDRFITENISENISTRDNSGT